MAQQDSLTTYAAQRAKLLLGCYRTGDANDPETYVAAITAILARYPEQVITSVTHPATGLPSRKSWLPTVREVTEACADAMEPIIQDELRLKRIKEAMEARERQEKGERPTLDQLKDRYGQNWGISQLRPDKTLEERWAEGKPEMDRSVERVDSEYKRAGLEKPSRYALSLTARKEMAERDEASQGHQ